MRLALAARNRDSARIGRSMKAVKDMPRGSIFTASRPSMKSTNLVRAFQSSRYLGCIAVQQIVDELFRAKNLNVL